MNFCCSSFQFDQFTPERKFVLNTNTCDELSSSKDSRSDSNISNSDNFKSSSGSNSNLVPSNFSDQKNVVKNVNQNSKNNSNSNINYLPIKAVYRPPSPSRCGNNLTKNDFFIDLDDLELTKEEKEEIDRKLILELKETLFINIENEIRATAEKEMFEVIKTIQSEIQQKAAEISQQKKRDLEATRIQNEIDMLLAQI